MRRLWLSGAASAVRGRLKVDIDPFFLPLVLAGRLGAFCERYPELSIEFVSSERIGDLVSEGIDLAIRFGQPRFSTLVVAQTDRGADPHRGVAALYRTPWPTRASL